MRWARYLISAVRFDETDTLIESVRVHEDNGDQMTAARETSRRSVISSLEDGETFCTIVANALGNWTQGTAVKAVRIDGEKYLRTDAVKKRADDLGRLPRF
jgi:hypothetical protein